jgi:hypothetical protein
LQDFSKPLRSFDKDPRDVVSLRRAFQPWDVVTPKRAYDCHMVVPSTHEAQEAQASDPPMGNDAGSRLAVTLSKEAHRDLFGVLVTRGDCVCDRFLHHKLARYGS